ncbi:LysR family transcriptional regulator [Pseudoroseicyclus tamaricis]|uniref:LysR family transcriptional regulator n=1 Tax=Pseudoroseicyclus tamaricis TaxID=2705421 RepID=A0A6B2JPL0_9RHOB|nr:LysR family transcriptional regulator [Pseudoroseicyclus tamaricis]NDV00617.1 LysR family transcriptional regulator [Pseudoroseicyclus tamaricis]
MSGGTRRQGNWDDLRYVVAVAETGSVTAAAKRLDVNHATVLRRITAFEEAHGTLVFRREATGYVVLPEQIHLIERAREAARAMEAVSLAARGAGGGPAPLRLTSTDSLCQSVLPEILAELGAEGLPIDLHAANHHVDLGRLAADLTIRPARALPDSLRGTKATSLGFAVYAAPGGAESWLALRGLLGKAVPPEWMGEVVGERPVRGGADSFPVLARMAATGMGRAMLPCILGDAEPGLRRLPFDLSHIALPIWVATHAELVEAPRLVAVKARLVQGLRARSEALLGWPLLRATGAGESLLGAGLPKPRAQGPQPVRPGQ